MSGPSAPSVGANNSSLGGEEIWAHARRPHLSFVLWAGSLQILGEFCRLTTAMHALLSPCAPHADAEGSVCQSLNLPRAWRARAPRAVTWVGLAQGPLCLALCRSLLLRAWAAAGSFGVPESWGWGESH